MRHNPIAAIAILLCMTAAMLGRPALAEDYFDPFTVKDVPVDVTASTAAEARNIAIGEAQSRALDMLLRRMTLKEDRSQVPHLDGNSVSRLVQSIEFVGERYSSTRYIAKVNVAFNPSGIRALLSRSNVAFAEAPAQPVLVLPVLENGGPRLQGDANPWWSAWARQDWQENLLSLKLPRPEEVAAAGPGAEEIMQGPGPWLDALGRRYGTSEILVAIATVQSDGAAVKLKVDVRHYGLAGERIQTVQFSQQPGETADALMMRAARDIGNQMTNEWKRNAMVGQGAQTQITAICDLQSLQELITVRTRLKQAPMIKTASIESLGTSRALISMTVTVPPEQLSTALVQYGIDMAERDGDWYVAARR